MYQDDNMYISSLHKGGYLENTFFLFFSDHGMRFGPIRESYSGKMEERLPFMIIVPPPWFKKRYPNHYNSLLTNRHRLTTPFDVFETLKEVLHFTREPPVYPSTADERSYSLFANIPVYRSCEDADILPHW